jgi:hypothetical protein
VRAKKVIMSNHPAPSELNLTAAHTRPVNWRQEYLHLTVILMNACWIAPWITLITGQFVKVSLNTVIEIGTVHLLASLLFVRWALHRQVHPSRIEARVILLMSSAAGLTVLFAPSWVQAHDGTGALTLPDLFRTTAKTNGVPVGLLIMFWALYVWRRGYRLSSGYITLVRASFGLRLGIVAFVWVLIFANFHLREEILSLVPIFFLFGLLSSGLARANSLNLDRAGPGSALGRGWMISLFGIAVILTLGGYVAALWLTGMDMSLVAAALGIVARVLFALVFLILAPALFLVNLVYNFFLTLLPDQATNSAADTGASGVKASHETVASWLTTLAQISSSVILAIVVLIVLITLLALIWFLLFARERQDEYQDEKHETLGTGAVVGGLRQTLRDNWQRLASMLGVLRQFGLGRELFTALTIRRIYAHMEKLAGARGYPRTLSETPYEYQAELHQAFPDLRDDIQCITEAYIAVRYGEIPEDPGQLERVRAAWQRLAQSADPKAPPNKSG